MAATEPVTAHRPDGKPFDTTRAQYDRVWKATGCRLSKPKTPTSESGTAGEGA